MDTQKEETIPIHMKIAIDGRTLGAWIGDEVDQATPWAGTVEKMNKALERWKRCSPTLKGK